MALFGRSKKQTRLPNIPVYALTSIVDGNAQSSPLGFMPRLTDDFERALQQKHQSSGTAYINETLNHVSVVLLWAVDKVEAISFLSVNDARAFPGFQAIPPSDLAALDARLQHFPR